MEMVHGLECDDHEAASFRVPLSAPWRRAAMSDASDTSEGEGEGESSPSSASASDSDLRCVGEGRDGDGDAGAPGPGQVKGRSGTDRTG